MAVIVALAGVIGACSGPSHHASTDGATSGAAGTLPTPLAASPPASAAGPAQPAFDDLPPPASLSLQAAHPDGVTIRLTQVTFRDDHIELGATITNGGDRDVDLAYFDDGMYLSDEGGVHYRLSPPPGNDRVTVSPKSTTRATFVFLGRISPRAHVITLVTNANTGDPTGQYTTEPTLRIGGIPVGSAASGETSSTTASSPTTSTSLPPSTSTASTSTSGGQP